MSKDKKSDFNPNWYDAWMQQSKQFFENLHIFTHPEEQFQEINQWLARLKAQWKLMELNEKQKAYQKYWQVMMQASNEAAEMMIKEWITRSKKNNPIKNSQELYELWLSCFKKVYEKSAQHQSYQEMYNELMQASLTYWKSVMPK